MGFEQKLAQLLDSTPLVRRMSKVAYLRLAYLLYGRGERQVGLAPIVAVDGFFGYYDKSPWNASGTHLVYHSAPLDNGWVGIELVDLESGQAQRLATTSAWNWQQGAMLQWLPGKNAVVFNAVEDGRLVAKILELADGREHLVPMPVQTLHPDGIQALALNYRRLFALRPEYGYAVIATNFAPNQHLERDGIWHLDLFNGEPGLIVSISQLIQISPREDMRGADHKVNHIMYSPSGKRFVFMHRWFGSRGKFSRLYVAENPNGSHLKLLMDERMVSHYCWRDDDHLLVYGRTSEQGDRYYLINVTQGTSQVVGRDVLDRHGDGHPSYSCNKRWILTDTYPDKARMRHLLLYDTYTEFLTELGRFFSPWEFDGPNRVDLHPRWSPDGKMVSIDSAHEGKRRTYLLDVVRIVDGD